MLAQKPTASGIIRASWRVEPKALESGGFFETFRRSRRIGVEVDVQNPAAQQGRQVNLVERNRQTPQVRFLKDSKPMRSDAVESIFGKSSSLQKHQNQTRTLKY
jgi:hypothetical protein